MSCKVDTLTGEVRIIASAYAHTSPQRYEWQVIVTPKRQYSVTWTAGSNEVTARALVAPGSGRIGVGDPSVWAAVPGFTLDADTANLAPIDAHRAVDAEIMAFIGRELIPDAPRLSCGHLPSSAHGIGFVQPDPDAPSRVCYACATVEVVERLKTAVKIELTLSLWDESVHAWPGQPVGSVVEWRETHGGTRIHATVQDVHGVRWYGSAAGDWARFTLRRAKIQPSHRRALPDERFTVGPEFVGDTDAPGPGLHQGQRWVVRFGARWIDVSALTRGEAIDAAHRWNRARLSLLGL